MSGADDRSAAAVRAAAEALALAAEELERATNDHVAGLELVDLPAVTAALAGTGVSLALVYGALAARVEEVRAGAEPDGDVDWVMRVCPRSLRARVARPS